MSRWLVTGAAGLLGTDLVAELRRHEHEVAAATRAVLDVTDPRAVTDAVRDHRPDVVVNAAAWTDVDGAESHEAEAYEVNARAVEHLARACAGAPGRPVLLQVSTDYVFDGDATAPYPEDAPTAPRSAYGRTKLAGEQAVREVLPDRGLVVRTAWVYGANGANFAATMLRLERERRPDGAVDVVDDQHGQPTSSLDLAVALRSLGDAALGGRVPPGTYHATSRGSTTWYGFAREVFRLAGADPDRVRPTTTSAFPRPAPRPAWSVLSHARWDSAGLPPLPPWQDALAAALPQLY